MTSSSSSTCSSAGGTGVGGASHGGMGAGGHKHKGGQLLPEGEEISNRDLEEQVNLQSFQRCMTNIDEIWCPSRDTKRNVILIVLVS